MPSATSDLRSVLRGVPTLTGTPPAFDPDEAPADPAELFVEWMLTAIDGGVTEPCAMTLSTVDAGGLPSARVLILKNVDRDGWQFASGATSRKGVELAQRPVAAMTFYWIPLARQVRIRGSVAPADPGLSAEDFLARPVAARAEALAARQSQRLPSRADIAPVVSAAAARIAEDPALVAPSWTLYTLRADEVEFWQADPARRHLRLRYLRAQDDWAKELLWP